MTCLTQLSSAICNYTCQLVNLVIYGNSAFRYDRQSPIWHCGTTHTILFGITVHFSALRSAFQYNSFFFRQSRFRQSGVRHSGMSLTFRSTGRSPAGRSDPPAAHPPDGPTHPPPTRRTVRPTGRPPVYEAAYKSVTRNGAIEAAWLANRYPLVQIARLNRRTTDRPTDRRAHQPTE